MSSLYFLSLTVKSSHQFSLSKLPPLTFAILTLSTNIKACFCRSIVCFLLLTPSHVFFVVKSGCLHQLWPAASHDVTGAQSLDTSGDPLLQKITHCGSNHSFLLFSIQGQLYSLNNATTVAFTTLHSASEWISQEKEVLYFIPLL